MEPCQKAFPAQSQIQLPRSYHCLTVPVQPSLRCRGFPFILTRKDISTFSPPQISIWLS